MKKFGRGFVLDFAALMDEVRQPPEEANNRTPSSATSPSFESSEGSPTARIDYTRSTSSGSGDAGNHSARSPVDPGSPTEDESPDFGGETIKRMPTRMSVSRTGRCKNRDRQRLTVLQTDHFYAAPPPSDLGKVRAPSPSESSKQKQTRDSTNDETIDFDSAINALDSSTQAPVVADCYSF